MLQFRQRNLTSELEARPKSAVFPTTSSLDNVNEQQLSAECPEFQFDYKLEFSEPVSPRLDLDTISKEKKNRHGIRFKGKEIEPPLISPHSPEEIRSVPSTPCTPTSPSRSFLGSCLGTPSSPKKLYSPTFFKKCFRSKSLVPERVVSEEARFSFPVLTTKTGGLRFQRSHSEMPADFDSRNSARPQANDEETEKLLYGFHVRKSCTALASNDFDDLIFKQDVPTLKLTLTPDWLHNNNNNNKS